MGIAMVYFSREHLKSIQLSLQMGVTEAVTGVDGAGIRGEAGRTRQPWKYEEFSAMVNAYKEAGLKVTVIEGSGFLDHAKLDLPDKDEQIENFCTLLESMGRCGVKSMCYNWMPTVGWFRTRTDIKTRGGALTSGFYTEDLPAEDQLTRYGLIKKETLWKTLEYFLKAAVPVAEKYGVNLALHPDDPPIDHLKGMDRILTSADNFQRVLDMVPSPVNGITMCQGSFAAMGEDIPAAIRRFGGQKKIFFAHFRDICGNKDAFRETFHDDGQTDMYEAMKAYYETGFDGSIRPDHVPTMAGEDNVMPGYATLGNLFAIGYMKGLMEAAGYKNI